MTSLFLTEKEPPRRGFLRSLVMAPAAAMATHRLILPADTIPTPTDPAARLQHHLKGVEAAMGDMFPGLKITSWDNCFDDADRFRARIAYGDRSAVVSVGCMAGLPLEGRR